MKNKANKRQLSQLLCTHDIGSNIELVSRTDSIVRHDEADISLISYMLKAAAAGADIVRILSDDTDVFVLLVYWCKKADVSCAVHMERWNGSVLDINATVTALGDKCRGLLGMHALSGCDTVSYPNGRGKVSALRVLTQTDIAELDSVLGEESATQTDLQKAGTLFFPSLYCQKESTSLNAARHDIYRKRKNPPPLEGIAVGLVDYRAPATVSAKEGIIAVIHILNRRRTKTSHSRATWIMMILRGKRVTD